jgi:hypothetical protein
MNENGWAPLSQMRYSATHVYLPVNQYQALVDGGVIPIRFTYDTEEVKPTAIANRHDLAYYWITRRTR